MCSQTFREWVVQHLFVNSSFFGDASQIKIPERFNQMIRDASEFMERNLEPEFLKELFPGVVSGASIVAGYCHTDATFDLNDVGMGTFMNLVLKKDKGIVVWSRSSRTSDQHREFESVLWTRAMTGYIVFD